jgi:hypothetical protein
MSSVAAALPPVNAVPTTNGVTSEVPAEPTNNAGTADDATTPSDPAGQNNGAPASPEETGHKVCVLRHACRCFAMKLSRVLSLVCYCLLC